MGSFRPGQYGYSGTERRGLKEKMECIFEKAEKRTQTVMILAGLLGFVVGIGAGIGIA